MQSIEVDDVIITVSAEHGVFPDGAVLSAQKVNDLEADKAVEKNVRAVRRSFHPIPLI